MDIKKFISSPKFESDYNKLIQLEHDTIKNKSKIKHDSDKFRCLHKVSECDFFTIDTTNEEMFNDPNILEFEKMCNDALDVRACLAYSGAMIKRYFDPNYQSGRDTLNNQHTSKHNGQHNGQQTSQQKPHHSRPKNLTIENCYVVTLIDPSGNLHIKDILKQEYKKKLESKLGFYIVQTTHSLFYLDKKTQPTISSHIVSNIDPLDRVALYNDDLFVSGMFIMEFYKKISCYDVNNIDPVFGFPEDVLGIYDRTPNVQDSIKYMIDVVDFESIQTVDRTKIENTFIVDGENRYTVLEYLISRMTMKGIHSVIMYQMKSMVLYLSNFQYFRPIFFVAKLTGFDKTFPGLYETLVEVRHKIDVDPNTDVTALESLYHIDLFIIKHLIKVDNDDLFVDYISRTGIVKKFKVESKTAEKIVGWVVEFKPQKIMNTLIDCMVLSDRHRYKVIFLTQEFNLLGKEFLARYVLRREPSSTKTKSKNTDTRIKIKHAAHGNPDHEQNRSSKQKNDKKGKRNNDKTDRMVDDDVEDLDRRRVDSNDDTNHAGTEHDDGSEHSNVSNVSDRSDVSITSSHTAGSNVESRYELDTAHQKLILENLPEIMNRGLTRSFYMILKLCPYVLTSEFSLSMIGSQNTDTNQNDEKRGNILHIVNCDKAVDIIEIILKKSPNMIDDKDDEGRTPLILYAELGLGNCVQKLLEFGADYELSDNKSDTFLHKLCQTGQFEIVQNTIRNVMSIIDAKNDLLMTPAIEATRNGHEEIFYILKGLNADLDACDTYGNTVYHYVCLSKICPGIMVVNKKNKYGLTPYDYCKLAPKYYHFQS